MQEDGSKDGVRLLVPNFFVGIQRVPIIEDNFDVTEGAEYVKAQGSKHCT